MREVIIIMAIFAIISISKYPTQQPIIVNQDNNFLSTKDCDQLITEAKYSSAPVRLYTNNPTYKASIHFLEGRSMIATKMKQRIGGFINSTTYGVLICSDFQVRTFKENEQYGPHYDEPKKHFTVLVFLNDDFDGGEVRFTKFNKVVRPEKGKAIVIRNLNKQGERIATSEYEEGVVTKGKKYCLKFYLSLQK